jgi:hypothetical protein
VDIRGTVEADDPYGPLGQEIVEAYATVQDATSKASLLHIEHRINFRAGACDAYGCVRTCVGETRVVAIAWPM